MIKHIITFQPLEVAQTLLLENSFEFKELASGYYSVDSSHPYSLKKLVKRWSYEMLDKKHADMAIIEFDIEKRLCFKVKDNNDILIKFISLDKQHIRLIAIPESLGEGSSQVYFKPTYLGQGNTLFSERIGFNGDGDGDNYFRFGWDEPEEGLKIQTLRSLMKEKKWLQFSQQLIPGSLSFEEKKQYYDVVKNIEWRKSKW
jgi:hypothetical protein